MNKFNSTRNFLKEVEFLDSQGMIKEYNKKIKKKTKLHNFCSKFGVFGNCFYHYVMNLKGE